jgi:hypothetical protein
MRTSARKAPSIGFFIELGPRPAVSKRQNARVTCIPVVDYAFVTLSKHKADSPFDVAAGESENIDAAKLAIAEARKYGDQRASDRSGCCPST